MKNKKHFVNDLFTEFEFDVFSNKDNISENVKLEYIKEMIILAKNDKQATLMYLAFALGSIVFLIEKYDSYLQSISFVYSIIFNIGLIFQALSSVAFFTYWRKTHRFHINVVSCLPTLNIDRTRDLWIALWESNKRYFKAGLLLLSLGIIVLFLIVLSVNLNDSASI